VPELQIPCSALTIKDREDAEYLLDATIHGGIDYIALSFAQCAQDIQDLIDVMDKVGTPLAERPLIIPKIEKPAALRNIDEILALSDGLMVGARRSNPDAGPAPYPITPTLTPSPRPSPHHPDPHPITPTLTPSPRP
jgi:hypothetical protein